MWPVVALEQCTRPLPAASSRSINEVCLFHSGNELAIGVRKNKGSHGNFPASHFQCPGCAPYERHPPDDRTNSIVSPPHSGDGPGHCGGGECVGHLRRWERASQV